MAQNGAANTLFAFFDADGSKGLSCDELKEGMKSSGIIFSDADVKTFFEKVIVMTTNDPAKQLCSV